MSYSVLTIPPFDKQLKRLVKKYPSLKKDLDSLEKKPEQGVNLGNNCFKIRISIASKGKGKSGGARVITNIVINQNVVYLVAIYDKSEKENLTESELKLLFKYCSLTIILSYNKSFCRFD